MASKIVRCAVYTRKSTEEGLEQAFNSLDAQREACEAYIASQAIEGWTLVAGEFDDGGYSGGNMDRPALKQLLAAIKAGAIDVIVVYKVDRLTRNLGDFARIVDVLDAANASFVSVTQAFNTTTSMGRLTLNVLLSFAQFEREVTGERIRDKIAASKAKGMWMGGTVPLGYDVVDRKLVPNETDVALVRRIFERYVALKSVLTLKLELDAAGVVSKVRRSRSDVVSGGVPISRGVLYQLLRNPLYVGKIAHRDQLYDGQQAAIIDPALFEQAQTILADNRIAEKIRVRAAKPSPLVGRIWDDAGNPMSPSHTTRGTRRYRYYVSRSDSSSATVKVRVPAGDLEQIVADTVRALLRDKHRLHDAVGVESTSAADLGQMFATARARADQDDDEGRCSLLKMVSKTVVGPDKIELTVDVATLVAANSASDSPLVITLETRFVRRGREMKLIVAPSTNTNADPALIKLVVKAFAARRAVETDPSRTVAEHAKAAGHAREYFGVLLRLSYLSPAIQQAILDGEQPFTLTRQKLARFTQLPHDWGEQARVLGFSQIAA